MPLSPRLDCERWDVSGGSERLSVSKHSDLDLLDAAVKSVFLHATSNAQLKTGLWTVLNSVRNNHCQGPLGGSQRASSGDDMRAQVIACACEVHGFLANNLPESGHSLSACVRVHGRILPTSLAKRLRQLTDSANALRHVTNSSLGKLTRDVKLFVNNSNQGLSSSEASPRASSVAKCGKGTGCTSPTTASDTASCSASPRSSASSSSAACTADTGLRVPSSPVCRRWFRKSLSTDANDTASECSSDEVERCTSLPGSLACAARGSMVPVVHEDPTATKRKCFIDKIRNLFACWDADPDEFMEKIRSTKRIFSPQHMAALGMNQEMVDDLFAAIIKDRGK